MTKKYSEIILEIPSKILTLTEEQIEITNHYDPYDTSAYTIGNFRAERGGILKRVNNNIYCIKNEKSIYSR